MKGDLNRCAAKLVPLHQRFGGLYSPDITFFSHGIRAVFAFSKPEEWFRCGVITVPALNLRKTNKFLEDPCLIRTFVGRSVDR